MTLPAQYAMRLRPLASGSFQMLHKRCWTGYTRSHIHIQERSRVRSAALPHHSWSSSHVQDCRLAAHLSNRRCYATDEKEKSTSTASNDRSSARHNPPIFERVKSNVSRLKPHENIYTLPNILTVTRLIAAPVVGYLVVHEQHVWAVALFVYAGITDLVDGWIARRWKLQTVVGSVIDPGADKLLMVVLVSCLAFKGALPLWLATIIFGRDVSLAIAAIYYRYASLSPPKTFTRYWDFSIPSAEVHPTQVSKYNTFLQLVLIGATTVLPLAPQVLLGVDVKSAVTTMQYVVAATTLWSGASYTWLKNAVVILGEDEELKKKQGFRGRMIIAASFGSFVALAAYLGFTKDTKSLRTIEANDEE